MSETRCYVILIYWRKKFLHTCSIMSLCAIYADSNINHQPWWSLRKPFRRHPTFSIHYTSFYISSISAVNGPISVCQRDIIISRRAIRPRRADLVPLNLPDSQRQTVRRTLTQNTSCTRALIKFKVRNKQEDQWIGLCPHNLIYTRISPSWSNPE